MQTYLKDYSARMTQDVVGGCAVWSSKTGAAAVLREELYMVEWHELACAMDQSLPKFCMQKHLCVTDANCPHNKHKYNTYHKHSE